MTTSRTDVCAEFARCLAQIEATQGLPMTFSPGLRRLVEGAVERLLGILDEMDGDPDLEPCCEDEGGQCEDEGDRDGDGPAPVYPSDDQRVVALGCGLQLHDVDRHATFTAPASAFGAAEP